MKKSTTNPILLIILSLIVVGLFIYAEYVGAITIETAILPIILFLSIASFFACILKDIIDGNKYIDDYYDEQLQKHYEKECTIIKNNGTAEQSYESLLDYKDESDKI